MTIEVAPLSTTVRVIEWAELPASVRQVPDNFDPLAEGVLMKHQIECLKMNYSISIIEKGRRTGITFARALGDTIIAASRKKAGGDNVFYVPDTKEKGLEYIGYCAALARVIVQAQMQGVSGIEEFVFDDIDDNGNSRKITSYRIRFSSGYQIVALSSRPANLRGLQGIVVIDEAAFHADVQAVLDAATALLIWGGKIVIISTHNGKSNPFNLLIKDVEAGKYGNDAGVLKVTFDDAVANGLYERICMMRGWTPTESSKEEWYTKIRNAYGPRKAAMREELDAIPRDGNGVGLPTVWIERAMREERPVVRLVLDEDFIKKPTSERESFAEDWIRKNIAPLLKKINPKERHAIGMDFARHKDFSCITPFAIRNNLTRFAPFIVEMNRVPTRQQSQILWYILDNIPRWTIAMDATGSGETLAEYTADRYGESRVDQVKLSRSWYGTNMPKLIQGFEDNIIDLPKDDNVLQDLRDIEEIDGIPMVVPVRRKDLKDPDLKRHGDSAVALALAWSVSVGNFNNIEYESFGERESRYMSDYDGSASVVTDDGFGTVSGELNFRGF